MFEDIFANLKDAAMFQKEVVDEGDGSLQKVFDQERFREGMKNMGALGAEMSKPIPPPQMLPPGQAPQMPQMQQPMINPYSPVNYLGPGSVVREGEMGGSVMREGEMNMMQQYSPQNMNMQQIMDMLKRAGY